jgi:RNA polymerase sigma factor (sigma-70 family)
MSEPDDHELLAQYAQGPRENSEAAFAVLAERHVNLVYSTALRSVGNAHAAEEVSQAVFIVLANKASRLSRRVVLSGWLYKTTRLTAANFLRGEFRRQKREQEAFMQSTLQEPADDPAWRQIAPLLDDALDKLGERDRNAIVLRFFEDKNLHEVGLALGASEGAAKMRVNRALEKLRKIFGKRGAVLSAVAIAGAVSANSVHAAPIGLSKTVSALAITKGAMAGGSTLALAKGVLKIMAWSYVKTGIVTGAVLLFAAGTTILAVKSFKAEQTRIALSTMQGAWEGTITVNQARIRVVIRVFRTNDTFRAVLDSVDQGAKDIPIPQLSARLDFFHAELPAIDADFQAKVSADDTEMTGTWKQLDHSYPLVLQRTNEADQVQPPLAADEYAPRSGSDLQGQWDGTLKVGSVVLKLVLKIAEPTPGTFQAQMDSLDQGAANLPVTSLTYQKPAVRLEMTAINALYEGNLNESGGEITGTWTQMGKKYPLTFRIAEPSVTAASATGDYGPGTDDQVQGHWKGQIQVNNVSIHVIFHIALMPDGSYSATMDSPDQGGFGIPATDAQFTYPNLHLEWKAIGGVYTGTLEHGKLLGKLNQGGLTLPLNLDRDVAK